MPLRQGTFKFIVGGINRVSTHNHFGISQVSTLLRTNVIQRPIVTMMYSTKPLLCHNSALFKNNNYRAYSTDGSQFPNIMDLPVFMWPNLIKSIRNWVLSNFIISRYFDRQFSLQEFVNGSKEAIEVVSHYVSKGDLKSLSGLVSPEAIAEVRQHLYNFSLRQQSELAISKEDIFLCFPYEIGIIFGDDDGKSSPQKRFVEITMCYHVLSGLKEMKENDELPPINFGLLPEYQNKIYIVNYRFLRDFSEGVEPNWIINGLNHFKPGTDSS